MSLRISESCNRLSLITFQLTRSEPGALRVFFCGERGGFKKKYLHLEDLVQVWDFFQEVVEEAYYILLGNRKCKS